MAGALLLEARERGFEDDQARFSAWQRRVCRPVTDEEARAMNERYASLPFPGKATAPAAAPSSSSGAR